MTRLSPPARILIIDDDPSVCASLKLLLKLNGHSSSIAHHPSEALEYLTAEPFDLVMQDMNFSRNTTGAEGLSLLKAIQDHDPDLPIILMTAWATIELAVTGIKQGASDFVAKPWDNPQLMRIIETNLQLSRSEPVNANRQTLDDQFDFTGLIGDDPALTRILQVVARVARTDAPVLILGETGTGKELIAEAIHRNSTRNDATLVKVNLGGIPTSLFESEMFGHVRGAFTDAHRDRQGRFAQAHQGTLFLDELGDLDAHCQSKLLRVLQDQQYQPLGSSDSEHSNCRIVSATSRPLSELVEQGLFREDLLYRLNLIMVEMPPLRHRRDDITVLARHFLAEISAHYQLPDRQLSQDANHWLSVQDWPGNVRELRQTIERTVLMTDQVIIERVHLSDQSTLGGDPGQLMTPAGTTLDQMQAMMIEASMARHQGNISQTARELGISRAALYRRMDKYSIAHDSSDEPGDD